MVNETMEKVFYKKFNKVIECVHDYVYEYGKVLLRYRF